MAIARVGLSNGGADSSSAGATFDAGAGSDRVMFVTVGTDSGVNVSGTPTFNSVPMSLLLNTIHGGGSPRLITYYLINPATGSNTLVFNLASADKWGRCAVVFSGALQSDPPHDTPQEESASAGTTSDVDVTGGGGNDEVNGATVNNGANSLTATSPVDDYCVNQELGGGGASGHFLNAAQWGGGATEVDWTGRESGKDYIVFGWNLNEVAGAGIDHPPLFKNLINNRLQM